MLGFVRGNCGKVTDRNRDVYGQDLSGSNSVVECQLPKLDVAGSNPVSRSIRINGLHHFVPPCAPFVLRLHHSQAFL